jgi:hypothetical protein
MDREPRYLGDGVYATFDGYHIWLRAQGVAHENLVALEPAVFAALLKYQHDLVVESQRKEREASRTSSEPYPKGRDGADDP